MLKQGALKGTLAPRPAPLHETASTVYAKARACSDPHEAIAGFTKALKLDPSLAVAAYARGLMYQRLDLTHAQALEDFTLALELDNRENPTCTRLARYARGVWYLRSRRLEQALSDLNYCIELDNSDAAAFYARASVYQGLNDLDLALEDFTRACELDPSTANAFYGKGMVLLKQRKYQPALEAYQQALKIEPSHVLALYGRALAERSLELHEQAFESGEECVRVDPSFGLAYNSLGISYQRFNRHQEAIAAFTRSIELQSEDVIPINRAFSYLALGMYEQAIAASDQTLRSNPRCERSFVVRGIAKHRLHLPDARVDLEQGERYLTAVIGRWNSDTWSRLTCAQAKRELAIIVSSNKKHAREIAAAKLLRQQALELIEQIVALEARFYEAWIAKAQLYYDRGDVQEASKAFRQAVQVNPTGVLSAVWFIGQCIIELMCGRL